MGWGYGIENGREIGYTVLADCDEPGCSTRIDRGLGYRCGGARNLREDHGCGNFFCADHRFADLCKKCEAAQPDEEEDDD